MIDGIVTSARQLAHEGSGRYHPIHCFFYVCRPHRALNCRTRYTHTGLILRCATSSDSSIRPFYPSHVIVVSTAMSRTVPQSGVTKWFWDYPLCPGFSFLPETCCSLAISNPQPAIPAATPPHAVRWSPPISVPPMGGASIIAIDPSD